MTRRRAAPGLVLVALLAGCAASPDDALRDRVAAVTESANQRDADDLRDEADRLRTTVQEQRDQRRLSDAEADRLLRLLVLPVTL